MPARGSHLRQAVGNREPAQALVLSAFAIAVLLAFVALVLNFGLLVVERRHLQTTADAAALAASMRILDQQVPGQCHGSAIATELDRVKHDNEPFLTSPQLQATYVDRSGVLLGGVGDGTLPVPGSAVGVQVILSGQFDTLLAGVLDHIDQMHARAQSQAGLRSPDSLVGPLPIAVPPSIASANTACGGGAYNLYAPSSVLLDLASTAFGYGDPHTNMQYWSDGSHDSGTLVIGSNVDMAAVGDISDVQTGLGDNATRQGRPDYITARVAVCAESSTPGTCDVQSGRISVVGFSQVSILRTDLGQPSVSAYFVPYAAHLTQ
jgi:hypothetical protein